MFEAGQTVFINDQRSTWHGRQATVLSVSERRGYEVGIEGVQFTYWLRAAELSPEHPSTTPAAPAPEIADEHPYDFSHSGLGIGGAGQYQEPPIVPTVEQMGRMERMERRARRCRRCGQSDVFDGAMFTTGGGGDVCDDCFG